MINAFLPRKKDFLKDHVNQKSPLCLLFSFNKAFKLPVLSVDDEVTLLEVLTNFLKDERIENSVCYTVSL